MVCSYSARRSVPGANFPRLPSALVRASARGAGPAFRQQPGGLGSSVPGCGFQREPPRFGEPVDAGPGVEQGLGDLRVAVRGGDAQRRGFSRVGAAVRRHPGRQQQPDEGSHVPQRGVPHRHLFQYAPTRCSPSAPAASRRGRPPHARPGTPSSARYPGHCARPRGHPPAAASAPAPHLRSRRPHQIVHLAGRRPVIQRPAHCHRETTPPELRRTECGARIMRTGPRDKLSRLIARQSDRTPSTTGSPS
jgi:hypothetical protein